MPACLTLKKPLLIVAVIFFLLPATGLASTDPLPAIYKLRPDLQSVFDSDTGLATSPKAGFLVDLEDWAHQYGWQEYPEELASYAPATNPPVAGKTPAPTITARDYIVVDASSGVILSARGADEVWPVASLTKLMTAQVALDRGLHLSEVVAVTNADNVGGARLYVDDGTTFSASDLLSAMLIGSANNAANALARAAGPNFVSAMNARASSLHLSHTHFIDASGIEPQNVSTAREVALFANEAFTHSEVQQRTTTVKKQIYAITTDEWRDLKTTNWMLYYPEYDDVYVTAGKTGYLEESGWNVVERLRPSANGKNQELLIVTFGSASRGDSFHDAEALAEWIWQSYTFASE